MNLDEVYSNFNFLVFVALGVTVVLSVVIVLAGVKVWKFPFEAAVLLALLAGVLALLGGGLAKSVLGGAALVEVVND